MTEPESSLEQIAAQMPGLPQGAVLVSAKVDGETLLNRLPNRRARRAQQQASQRAARQARRSEARAADEARRAERRAERRLRAETRDHPHASGGIPAGGETPYNVLARLEVDGEQVYP